MLQFNKSDIDQLYLRIDFGTDQDNVIGLFYKKYQDQMNQFQESCMFNIISPTSILFIRMCQHIDADLLTFNETVDAIKTIFGRFDSNEIKSEIYILFHKAIKSHLAYRKKHIHFSFPLGMYVEKAIVFGLRDIFKAQYRHYDSLEYREIEDYELTTTLNDNDDRETRLWLEEIYAAYSKILLLKPIDFIYIHEKSLGYSVIETMEKFKIKEGVKSNVFKNLTSRIKKFKTKFAGKTDVEQQNTCART